MRVTSTLQRTVLLVGVIALATRTVHANPNTNPDPQGPGFGVPFNWGAGGNVNGNGNAQHNPAYNNGNGNSNNNNNNNGNNANNNNNNNVNNNSTSGSNAGNALTTNNNENSDSASNPEDSSSSNSLRGGGGPGSGSNGPSPPFPGSSSSPGNNNGDDDDDFGEGFGHGGENYGYSLSTLHTYGTAHGALAALAFVFLFPLGGILMRLRVSLPWHIGAQMLGWALYVAGAGLGIYLVSMGPGFDRLTGAESEGEGEGRFGGGDFFREVDDDDDGIVGVSAAHPIIGLVLLGVMTLQPIWGYIHHRRFVRATRGGGGDGGKHVVAPRRTWPSYLHIWAGRLGITLGIINGGLGLWLADASRGAVIAYSVIAAIIWLVWILTILVGGRKKASARRDAEIEKARSKAVAVPPRHSSSAGFVPSVRGGTGGHGSETSSRTVTSIGSDSSRPASSGRDSSIVVGSTHHFPAVPSGVSSNSSSSPYTHAHPNPNTAGAADSNNAGDADAGPATVAAAALPPYSPGPNYEAHMAQIRHEQEQQSRGLVVGGGGEMQEGMKKAEMERSSSPSILSELQDEMHRGQV